MIYTPVLTYIKPGRCLFFFFFFFFAFFFFFFFAFFFFFFFFFFFLCVSQLDLWGSPFCVCDRFFFNPAIEVVTFHLD